MTAYTPAPIRRPRRSRQRAARPHPGDPSPWQGLHRWARRTGWPGTDLRITAAIAEIGVRTGRTCLYLGRNALSRVTGTSPGGAARSLERLVDARALVPVERTKGGRKHAHTYQLGDLRSALPPPVWGGRREPGKATQVESHRAGSKMGPFRIQNATQVESPTPSLRSGDPWSPPSVGEVYAPRACDARARGVAEEPAAPSPDDGAVLELPASVTPVTAATSAHVAEGVGVDGFAPGPFEQRLAALLSRAPELFGVDTSPPNRAQCVEPASSEALPAPDHGASIDPPGSGCDTPRADA